jgi:hypothetical protein
MNNFNGQLLSISKASRYLGISIATLRRWDKKGSFKATFITPSGYRFYSLSDLERKTKGIFRIAQEWVNSDKPYSPAQDFYCQTSDVFKFRHEKMAHNLDDDITNSLISSAAGEIGNNSFDHNLGNWPDTMGAFFAHDLNKRRIVLADRGMGILTTLRHVKPELQNDEEALLTAFTKYITGRAPEHRGNGLKYVIDAIRQAGANFFFQSGNAILEMKKNKKDFTIKKADTPIHGCLSLIEF